MILKKQLITSCNEINKQTFNNVGIAGMSGKFPNKGGLTIN